MNTFRIARHRIFTGRGPVGLDRRGIVNAVLLCAALFIFCFAIGRATTPGSAPLEPLLSRLPAAASVDNPVPARLSGVPPIEMQTTAVPAHSQPSIRRQASHPASAQTTERAGHEETSGEQPSGTETAPPPSSTPSPSPSPASPLTPAKPQPTQEGNSGHPRHRTSGGTSFDSSG